MATFRNKLSHLIAGQLPEYIRNEYPVFVRFLKAYYEFLEETEGANDLLLNASSWTDIDQTLDDFVTQLRYQYAWDIPPSVLLEQRRLIKYIGQYYEAKGSENATELFFRFMFNDKASVVYPGDNVLKASDGVWKKPRSVKLDNTQFPDNSPFDLAGTVITLTYLEFVPNIGPVRRTQTTSCLSVIRCGFPNIFRLDVDLRPDYEFPSIVLPDTEIAESLGNHDSHIYVQSGDLYYGSLSGQLVSVNEITDPGSGYHIRDSYLITDEASQNEIVVHVHRVDRDTGLNRLQMLSSGQRFPLREDFGVAHYFDATYLEDSDDYAVDEANTIPVSTFEAEILGPEPASVIFNVGFIFEDFGYFKNNRGFLSDTNRLQDNYKYQPYSYMVRSSLPRSRWEQTYLKSNHPAGFKAFGEMVLENDVALTTVSVEDDLIINELLFDTLTTTETLAFDVSKSLQDYVAVSGQSEHYFSEDYLVDVDDYASSGYPTETILIEITTPELNFSESLTVDDSTIDDNLS
jgi:hypothetical protein